MKARVTVTSGSISGRTLGNQDRFLVRNQLREYAARSVTNEKSVPVCPMRTVKSVRESHPMRDVFHAVADPTRRALLDRLYIMGASVSDLSDGFAVGRAAISKHLRVLLRAGLVTYQRAGRERIFRLAPRPLRKIASWMEKYVP
jgi:DNA-binding transcriptional ArsR family regulator